MKYRNAGAILSVTLRKRRRTHDARGYAPTADAARNIYASDTAFAVENELDLFLRG